MDYTIMSSDIVDQLHENYRNTPPRQDLAMHEAALENAIKRAADKRKDPPEVEKLFASADRIYLDLTQEDGNRPVSDTEKTITAYLVGYKMVYGTKTDMMGDPIAEYVSDPARDGQPKYKVTDYINGYATDETGKQQYKIGRLLKDNPQLAAAFNTDNMRMMYGGNLMIVISRKTEDIANMSTGRNWISCMSPGGEGTPYIPKEIENGSLVAYLVRKSDMEIERPLARIMIKPYFKMNEQAASVSAITTRMFQFNAKASRVPNVFMPKAESQEVLFRPAQGYGLTSREFEAAITHFVDRELNIGKQGDYRLAPGIYKDGMASHVERNVRRTLEHF